MISEKIQRVIPSGHNIQTPIYFLEKKKAFKKT
jgi:hypothetical protein